MRIMRVMSYIRTGLLLIALLAGAMFIKTSNGKPLLPGGDMLLSLMDISGDAVSPAELMSHMQSVGFNSPTKTFYQWKDEKGEWQFSDTLPTQYQELKLVTVRTDANVISSEGFRDDKEEEASPRNNADSSKVKFLDQVMGKYNGSLVDKLMQGTQ